MTIPCALAIIFSLCSGNWLKAMKVVKSNPLAWFCILFALISLLGIIGTNATHEQAINSFRKHLLFIYPVLLIPATLYLGDKGKEIALKLFIIGAVLLSIIGILSVYSNAFYQLLTMQYNYPHVRSSPIIMHTDAGYIGAFAAYLSAIFLLQFKNKKLTLFYICSFIILSYYSLFINIAKTGYLTYALLAIVFVIQNCTKTRKQLIIAIIFLCLLIAGAYITSNKIKELHHLYGTVVTVDENANTSFGIRYLEFQSAIKYWEEAPIIGHGTGSAAPSLNHEILGPQNVRTRDLTEFAQTMVENGIVGLISLLGIIISMLYLTFKETNPQTKKIMRAFVWLTVFNAFNFGSFTVDPSSYFILLFIGYFYIPSTIRNAKISENTSCKN